jgi:hypothetical protein
VVRPVAATDVRGRPRDDAEAVDPSEGTTPMNGFQHLPEYAAAERSYRLERTAIPRRHPRPARAGSGLRDLVAALLAHPARRLPAAR